MSASYTAGLQSCPGIELLSTALSLWPLFIAPDFQELRQTPLDDPHPVQQEPARQLR